MSTELADVIARRRMNPTGGAFPAVLGSASAPGQGVISGPGDGGDTAADHLLGFNQLGDTFLSSSVVAPASLYANGDSGGAKSYDACAIAGNMQLNLQGEGDLSRAFIANEAGPGTMRFAIQDNNSLIDVLDVGDHNCMNGEWHYIRGVYDPSSGSYSMLVAGESGYVDAASKSLPGGWGTLRTVDGNMFIGRNTFPLGADPRTFLGLIDEVQNTRGHRFASAPRCETYRERGAATPISQPPVNCRWNSVKSNRSVSRSSSAS